MMRLGLLLLPLCLACDLKEKEIGDSGDVGDSDSEGGEAGDSEGDEEGQACTAIGCDDGLFVTVRHQGLADGNYQFLLSENGTPIVGCDFGVVAGQVEDSDCILSALTTGSEFEIHFPVVDNPSLKLLYDGIFLESTDIEVQYEDVYPNGPECGVGCTQGHWTMELGTTAAHCEGLEMDFWAEHDNVRGCAQASDCGQVMENTSCGCTQDWVARNDADLDRFYELWAAGGRLGCDWALFGSDCSCPEADGFACIAELCTWNYL